MEAYAGRAAMEGHVEHLHHDKGRPTDLFKIMREHDHTRLTSSVWGRALEHGDELAHHMIDRAVRALGAGVASVANVLDVEAIVIGGGLGVRLGQPYVKRIADAMLPAPVHGLRPGPRPRGGPRGPRGRDRRLAAGARSSNRMVPPPSPPAGRPRHPRPDRPALAASPEGWGARPGAPTAGEQPAHGPLFWTPCCRSGPRSCCCRSSRGCSWRCRRRLRDRSPRRVCVAGAGRVIPPLSVIGFVFVTRAAENASADGLTYLALVCRAAARRARPRRARAGCPRLGRAAGAAVVRARLGRPRRAGRGRSPRWCSRGSAACPSGCCWRR